MEKNIIEELIKQLGRNEGEVVYGSSLVDTLFRDYYRNNTITYNKNRAQEWLNENEEEVEEEIENMKNNGKEVANKEENPEMLMLQIYVEVAERILENMELVKEHWNNQLILDAETIEKMEEELEGMLWN